MYAVSLTLGLLWPYQLVWNGFAPRRRVPIKLRCHQMPQVVVSSKQPSWPLLEQKPLF